MARAVNPFVREAKQHLSPEAVPIAPPTWRVFRMSARDAPLSGAVGRESGPERQMEGRYHDEVSPPASPAVVVLLAFGGPPIMPPSITRTPGGLVLN